MNTYDDVFWEEQLEFDNYFKTPYALYKSKKFKHLSIYARSLYCLMRDRVSLSKKNRWIDENGVYIRYSVMGMMDDLDCSKNRAIATVNELVDAKLIQKRIIGRGKPNRFYIKDILPPDGERRSSDSVKTSSRGEPLPIDKDIKTSSRDELLSANKIGQTGSRDELVTTQPVHEVNPTSSRGEPPLVHEVNPNQTKYNQTKYIQTNNTENQTNSISDMVEDIASLSAGNNKIEEDNSNLYNSDYVEDYDSQTEYSPSPTPSHIDARRNYLERTKNVMPPPEYFEQFKTKPDVTTSDDPSGDAPADEPPIKEEPAYLANMRLALKHREEELAAKAPDPTKSSMQIAHEKQMADQSELEAALAECDWYPEEDE